MVYKLRLHGYLYHMTDQIQTSVSKVAPQTLTGTKRNNPPPLSPSSFRMNSNGLANTQQIRMTICALV